LIKDGESLRFPKPKWYR